jgi:preprotein translocase subunit YajC
MTLPLSIAPLLMAAPQNGQGGVTSGVFLFEIVLIVGIFYFLLIRPQRKQQRQHQEALSALKKGDEVVTSGGVVGEVVHIKETPGSDGVSKPTMADRITIKSGETRLIVERGRISKIFNAQGVSEG